VSCGDFLAVGIPPLPGCNSGVGKVCLGVVDTELLGLVCCPVSRCQLREASEEELARLHDMDGFDPSDQALVTVDGDRAYPVFEGIPVLLPEAGIVLKKSV